MLKVKGNKPIAIEEERVKLKLHINYCTPVLI
jgi:hypothetical protein